jgi:hypothetical protein
MDVISVDQHYNGTMTDVPWDNHSFDIKMLQVPCMQVQHRLTTTKENYKVALFHATAMLVASWNAVSQEFTSNCFQNAGFCGTPEHCHEKDMSEVSPSIWKYVQQKKMAFTTEKDVQADDNVLPCTVQETNDPLLMTRMHKLMMQITRNSWQQYANQMQCVTKEHSV